MAISDRTPPGAPERARARRVALAALAALAALPGCTRSGADPTRPSASVATAAPASSASAPSATGVASAASAPSVTAAIPLGRSESAPPPTAAPPTPRLSFEDNAATGAISAAGWLKARGIPAAAFENRIQGCAPTKLGAPPRDGLVCDEQPPMPGSLPSGESLFPLTLWVVEGRTLRVVLEVPIAAGPLDREEPMSKGDPHAGNYVTLRHAVDPSGLRVEVRERDGNASCASEIARMPKDAPKILRVMRATCAVTGVYTWQNGRFVRTAAIAPPTVATATAPAPLPTGAPARRGSSSFGD